MNFPKIKCCLSIFSHKSTNFNFLKNASPIIVSERFATHKPAQGSRGPPRPPGVKRLDGQNVRSGEILVIQRFLTFHPGLNVNMLMNNTLTSMIHGTVVITCEKINPKAEGYVATKFYRNLTAPVVYKRFFNVLPFPQGKKFELVDLV